MSFEHHMDSEGLTFESEGWKRVFAIGDVHGDLPALLEIFYCLGLVDLTGNWCADGKTLVVLAGDLIDRGGDSTNLIAYIARLQREANAAGSHVELLLGNHEVMAAVGDYRYMCPLEGARLADLWINNQNGLNAIFRGASPYAEWLRNRPLMVRIGGYLLVHAGVGDWIQGPSISEHNALAASWIAYFQGATQTQPRDGQWLVADEGPLWTRAFDTGAGAAQFGLSKDELRKLLACQGAERLLVAHCPTLENDFEVSTSHPVYGEAVVNIDTGISYCFQGRLSAAELSVNGVEPRYFERLCRPELVASVRRNCHRDIRKLADCYAATA